MAEGPVEESPAAEEVALEVPAPAPPEVELLIPPPPPDLEERTQARARSSSAALATTGARHEALPPPSEEVAAARANVQEPAEETEARAEGGLTAALREQPAPSPEIEQLCDDIQDAIENRRPPDEASLRRADPAAEAQAVGDALNDDISGEGERVAGDYDAVNAEASGTPEQVSEPLPDTPPVGPTPDVAAANVTPPPATEADVSLEADRAATADRIAEANIDNEVTREIPGPPFSDAREGMAELEQAAAEDPALVLQEQEEAIATSRQGMRDIEARTLAALEASRDTTTAGALNQQIAMAGSEEEQRIAAAAAAESIFTTAQTAVNDLLQPMVSTAMSMWNTGKERIATAFDTDLQRAKDMVDERHEGIGGAIVSIWDDVAGLPYEITSIYTSAERTFGRDICALIREVSTYVNGIVIACEEIIDNADRDISELFANLPANLQDWAAGQQAGFEERLTGLRDDVHTAQQDFTSDLVSQAGAAVQEARERIDALREAAKGLIQKVADAIESFIDDPVRAIINGLLTVVGIAPAAFWALVAQIEQVAADIADDPMNFANNLLAAVRLGFSNFFDHFFGHLMTGFINWLFSAMGTVGVELPPDTSLKSIITFFLQLMGLTWPNIREILVRHIGEQNVELIEKAYELLTLLIEEGPGGIFEMIKERLDPAAMMQTVIEAAVSYMVETIVSMATVRILGLFNPAGAILQAIEAIYKVLKWIFENAARIFTLVQTIVGGIADLIAGNIAGMAAKTEEALAGLLVPVIDFIAGFLGLGDLPEKIAEVVGGFQQLVLEAVDRAIGFLVERARGVLQALGLGGDAGAESSGGDEEVGKSISFSADGEGHRIWIDASGGAPEVMVASETESLAAKVRRWNTDVHLAKHKDNKEEILTLLPTVNRLLGITVAEATEAKVADEAKDQNSTPETQAEFAEQDAETEAAQEALVPLLVRLFELFGEEVSLAIFDAEIERMAPEARGDAKAELEAGQDAYLAAENWEAVKTLFLNRSGSKVSPLYERPLGRSDLTRPFHITNFDQIFLAGLNEALTKVATDRDTTVEKLLTKKEVKIEAKEYAERRRGTVHGQPAPQNETDSSSASGQLADGLRKGLFASFSVATLKGLAKAYFLVSLEGFKPHSDYKPSGVSYELKDGVFTISYKYDDPDDSTKEELAFTVAFEIIDRHNNEVSQTTTGRNLRLKTPNTRGETLRSGKGKNEETFVTATGEAITDVDSAHVLGDQFMGSGYRESLNLIVTSANYNRQSMAEQERFVANQVDTSRFNLVVRAEWRVFTDQSTSDQLARHLDTTALHDTTQDELESKVKTLLQSNQDPRIVLDVFYTPTLLNPERTLNTVSIDAFDSWLADQLGLPKEIAGRKRAA